MASLAAEIAVPLTPVLTSTAALSRGSLTSGTGAVVRGALDAGVQFSASYPGTPATDILQGLSRMASPDTVRCFWSVNEKVAYESAFAVAVAGQRSLVAMKHVGLNVAADAFVSSCYSGVKGGLVLVVADDPGCHSSQNEQDSRYYQRLAGTLLLEPSDPQEAYEMTRAAFDLSERFELPVMLRLNTRTALGHARLVRSAPVRISRRPQWDKNPNRFLLVPSVSRRRRVRLAGVQTELSNYLATCRFTERRDAPSYLEHRTGLLCVGVGAAFARELMDSNMGLLKIAGEPFPCDEISAFLEAHDRVLVLEDGDPFTEELALNLARDATRVEGRLSGHLSRTGEIDYEQAKAWINQTSAPALPALPLELPIRLPEICKPCGYHKVFGALAEMPELVTPSDIGCNTLGGLAPYGVMDSNLAMGASIGMACGLAAQGLERIVAIIGDSTFYHAGIPPLLEAVHQGHHFTVLLLDNGAAAMTGGQGVPHRPTLPHQNKVDLPALIQALGVTSCTPFDPHKLGKDGIRSLVEDSFRQSGIKVLLYRSQCGLHTPGYFTEAPFALKPREKERTRACTAPSAS